MYRQKHIKKYSFVICCILILNLLVSSMPVFAAGETIVLNDPDKSEFQAFSLNNMFPGDEEYKDYKLNISHKKEDIKDSSIMFNVYVREDSADLAEVLELRVEVLGEEEPLYNGPMKEMTGPVTYTLPASQKEVTYRLTVSLDTSVGNKSEKDPEGKKYQNKTLRADFEWYYMIESTGGGGNEGGGNEGGGNEGGGNEGGGNEGGGNEGGGNEGGGNQGGGNQGGGNQDGGNQGGGTTEPGVGTTKMLRRAYVIGRPNDLFEPEAPITRAETATILARIFADYNEDNLISTDTKFKDVADSDWYAKYVSRCEDENIIFGYEGYFRPSDNITRAEFATMCVRFFEKRSGTTIEPVDREFSDFDSSHWAYETIEKACANGYVDGYPDGTLRPDKTITRAEAVTIVNRMLERIPDKEYIDNNLNKLIDFVDVRDNKYWAYYEIFEAANTHYVRFVNDFAKWVD